MAHFLKSFFNRRVGLVLGSGGAKGLAHIAVIETLQELGVPIHCVTGSSVGSIAAALFCEGKLAQVRNDVLAMKKKDFQDLFDFLLPVNGLIGTRSIMKFLENYIPAGRDLRSYMIELRIVATDYNTGKTVVFSEGSVLEAIRASIAIPGVFPAVPRGHSFLIDGGVADPLPLDVVRDMGAGRVIAVNLHPAVKEKNHKKTGKMFHQSGALMAAEPEKESRGLEPVQFLLDHVRQAADFGKSSYLKLLGDDRPVKTRETRFPTIFENILQTLDIMNYYNTQYALRQDPPDVLIEPRLLDFDSLDFHRGEEALEEGRNACLIKREQLKRIARN